MSKPCAVISTQLTLMTISSYAQMNTPELTFITLRILDIAIINFLFHTDWSFSEHGACLLSSSPRHVQGITV